MIQFARSLCIYDDLLLMFQGIVTYWSKINFYYSCIVMKLTRVWYEIIRMIIMILCLCVCDSLHSASMTYSIPMINSSLAWSRVVIDRVGLQRCPFTFLTFLTYFLVHPVRGAEYFDRFVCVSVCM